MNEDFLTIQGFGNVPMSAVNQAMQQQNKGNLFNGNQMGQNGGFEFGLNAPTFKMGLDGLGTIGNLWGAWQANKIARDQLDYTKDVTNTNLANQIKSYNTTLEDRARARGAMEGQSAEQTQQYIDQNRLRR
jgi:hypothetical protein